MGRKESLEARQGRAHMPVHACCVRTCALAAPLRPAIGPGKGKYLRSGMSAHSLNSACLFRLLRAALIFESTTPCVGTGPQPGFSPAALLEAAAGFSGPVPSWLGRCPVERIWVGNGCVWEGGGEGTGMTSPERSEGNTMRCVQSCWRGTWRRGAVGRGILEWFGLGGVFKGSLIL